MYVTVSLKIEVDATTPLSQLESQIRFGGNLKEAQKLVERKEEK